MYTIMTVVGREVIHSVTNAEWRDVIEFATEVDEYEESWVDHDFVEQVRDGAQGLRRHHDGAGMVLRIAFLNPPVTLRKASDR